MPRSNKNGIVLFLHLVTHYPEYCTLYLYRLRHYSVIARTAEEIGLVLAPKQHDLYLTTDSIVWNLIIQHGFSTVITAKSIGEKCWINQQVTIGYFFDNEPPTIGNGCIICAGAKVIGDVVLGDNVIVSANAVVTHSFGDNEVVGGVPAHSIGINEKHRLYKKHSKANERNTIMNILMIASGFELGGVTSAMRNLCNELTVRGHQVDILDLPREGTLPEGFDRRIKLISLSGFAKNWNLSMTAVQNATGLRKLWLLLLGALKKVTNKGSLWHQIVFRDLRLDKHYDISIGFRQSPVSYWLAKYKCDSDLSVGFWHTDADFENISQLEECLHYPDKICCVSNAIAEQMRKKYPSLSNKFCVVYNLFDVAAIRELSVKEKAYFTLDTFNIVTVGRLSPQKKITVIPQICSVLKNKGLRFKWYIVGDGEEREVIENEIAKYGVSDCMILLGAKNNPFPYMKEADLFVLTSAWESYGMVVTESLILGTPVVAGDYPALHEILDDGINGIISENSVVGIANAVEEVMNSKQLYVDLKKGAECYNYSTDLAVNQLLSLKG